MRKKEGAPVVAMNFSGVYDMERFDKAPGVVRLDFSQLRGTAGYCSREAARAIKERIRPYGPCGIHFLDSGDYHYVSKFWTDMITEPFSLVLVDHHTDMQDSRADGMLSCGDWVKAVIEQNEHLEKVVVAGVPPESASKVPAGLLSRVEFVTGQEFADMARGGRTVGGGAVYVSIDKDALSPEDAVTNWDQGDMRERDLRSFLARLVGREDVIGVDVCGEFQVAGDYFADRRAAEKDDAVNEDLLLAIDMAARRRTVEEEEEEG